MGDTAVTCKCDTLFLGIWLGQQLSQLAIFWRSVLKKNSCRGFAGFSALPMLSCQCSPNMAGDTGQSDNATAVAVPLQQSCLQIPLHVEPVPAGQSIITQLGVGRLPGFMQNCLPVWVAGLPQKCRLCPSQPVLTVGSGLTAARPADTAAQPRFADRPLPKCPYTSGPHWGGTCRAHQYFPVAGALLLWVLFLPFPIRCLPFPPFERAGAVCMMLDDQLLQHWSKPGHLVSCWGQRSLPGCFSVLQTHEGNKCQDIHKAAYPLPRS